MVESSIYLLHKEMPGRECASWGRSTVEEDRAERLASSQKFGAAEKIYRKNVIDQAARYKLEPTECQLESLNQSRQKLAGVLMAQDKFSEAEKLLHDSLSDVETRRYGRISNEEAHKLLKQFVVAEDADAKLTQVEKAFERSAKQVRHEVKTYGVDPANWLAMAMKKNSVLAIGEGHTDLKHLKLGGEIMDDLKAAGATHLAVELPSNHQVVLDHFAKTGLIDFALLKDSEGTNEYLASYRFLQRGDIRELLKSAREAGLKLIAVDDAVSINVGIYNAVFGQGRDRAMAAAITNVLRQDPKNKVVYWVGALHAQISVDKRDHERACQLLREQGIKVSSVLSKEKKVADNNPLFKITEEVKVPTLVPMAKARALSKLPELKSIYPGVQNFNSWDAVIIYPQK